MISFEEAYKIVVNSECTPKKEPIDFLSSVNRVLAEDVFSDMDMPPFDKTAVDGYACRIEDIKNDLEVIELIPAGKSPVKTIGKNQCSKIMTGAMIPKGASCILMVEHIEEKDNKSIHFIKNSTAANICYKAEDVKIGQLVLNKGTLITPAHIAVLASVGCVNPVVGVKPRVAIISTGNELVEPANTPQQSQIRNSNAYQLISQVEKLGGIANYMGIAEDTEEATFKIISKALEGNDVIILTGGVSMGDYDYVPKILKQLEFETLFHSIAVQPGRPTVFAKNKNVFCFGLPGNPVSSYIQFEMLVKPLLYKLSGYNFESKNIKLPLAENYTRKKTDRLVLVPIFINSESRVLPVEYHGSAHINALTVADGIMIVPLGTTEIKKGEFVDVRQI